MDFRFTFPVISCTSVSKNCGLRDLLPKVVLYLLIVLWPQNIFSQQTISGVPLSSINEMAKVDEYVVMPAYSQEKKAAPVSDRLKRLEFAHVFDLSLNPENSGQWTILNNGDRIWRIGLTSKGAYSLNLIFGIFRFEPDVKLYIYSPDQKNILGAFSSFNNNMAETLAIEPLKGDSLVIELDVPATVNKYGNLEISRLGHDFTNIFGNSYKNFTGTSGSGACNIDINCDIGLEWQREKHAVCKLIINARDFCTGTLINNTAKDKTPYIITAEHCINSSNLAASTVFIFDYEKWQCGGQDGPKPVSVSGSYLVATTPNLDFALLKAYNLPPFIAKPYFAGWDNSGDQPQRTVTIHHPNGDFKKISIDEDPAISSTFEEDYDSNTHWLINNWDAGTTERGSSGAPLFNQNHLFVGSLTGGDASCSSPINDYFAKFSDSWADYSGLRKQLKHWLDPINSDSSRIGGLDPYINEYASCDTLHNISAKEPLQLYNTNLDWGYYSGHNSKLYTQFAEKINVDDSLKISGFCLNAAKAYNASALSFITVKIWKNGAVPGDEICSRQVYLKDIVVNHVNYFNFDSVLFVKGPVYLGYSINYAATKKDTFALYQSANRGESGTSGMMVFKDGLWSNISEVTTPSIHSSLDLGLISCRLLYPIHETSDSIMEVKAYPNPIISGILTVDLPTAGNVIVSIVDLTGRSIRLDSQREDKKLMINTSALKSGLYFLKILVPGKETYIAKFLVLK